MTRRNGLFFMGMFGYMYNNGAFANNYSTPNLLLGGQLSVPFYSPSTPEEQIGFWSFNVASAFGGGATATRAAFATKADESIFYSGQGAGAYANRVAAVYGGKTIEMTFGGTVINKVTNTPILAGPFTNAIFVWPMVCGDGDLVISRGELREMFAFSPGTI
jgi:hypothetical protein